MHQEYDKQDWERGRLLPPFPILVSHIPDVAIQQNAKFIIALTPPRKITSFRLRASSVNR